MHFEPKGIKTKLLLVMHGSEWRSDTFLDGQSYLCVCLGAFAVRMATEQLFMGPKAGWPRHPILLHYSFTRAWHCFLVYLKTVPPLITGTTCSAQQSTKSGAKMGRLLVSKSGMTGTGAASPNLLASPGLRLARQQGTP